MELVRAKQLLKNACYQLVIGLDSCLCAKFVAKPMLTMPGSVLVAGPRSRKDHQSRLK